MRGEIEWEEKAEGEEKQDKEDEKSLEINDEDKWKTINKKEGNLLKEGRKDTSPKLFKDSISQNETGPSQKM